MRSCEASEIEEVGGVAELESRIGEGGVGGLGASEFDRERGKFDEFDETAEEEDI